MKHQTLFKILTLSIAAVWVINGLFCKVLQFAPRHREIVATILGNEYATELTLLIGFSELLMAVWIVSGFYSTLNAVAQITVVATMNLIEYFTVPDLLLWGKLNSVFALLFIGSIVYWEFVLRHKLNFIK